MNITEIRGLTADQLKEKFSALKKEAFNLRFQQATGELKNTARIKAVRKAVARIKTVQNTNEDVKTATKAAKPAKAAKTRKSAEG